MEDDGSAPVVVSESGADGSVVAPPSGSTAMTDTESSASALPFGVGVAGPSALSSPFGDSVSSSSPMESTRWLSSVESSRATKTPPTTATATTANLPTVFPTGHVTMGKAYPHRPDAA